MSWALLAEGVRGLWSADTGVGGLNEPGGSYQLTGWFTERVPESQRPPYVVVSLTTEAEDHVGDPASELREFDFDAELVVNAEIGMEATDALRSKLRGILHRQTPTVTGYTAHHLFRQSSDVFVEEQRIRYIDEYTASIAKGA